MHHDRSPDVLGHAFRQLFGGDTSQTALIDLEGRVLEATVPARRALDLTPGVAAPPWVLPLLTTVTPGSTTHHLIPLSHPERARRFIDVAIDSCGSTPSRPAAYLLRAEDVTDRHVSEREELLLARIALALGQTESLDLAVRTTLQHICEATEWELGEAWMPHRDQTGDRVIIRGGVWSIRDHRLHTFVAQGGQLRFGAAEGIPGTAWTTRTPVVIDDLRDSPVFTRAPLASIAGLRGAVAIPLVASADVVAVLVFFMRTVGPDHAALVHLASAVATPLAYLLQQKQTEEAHRLTEAKLSGMIAIAADAIISIDHARRITLFNWGAERIFGYTSDEMLGQPIDVLLPPELRSLHAAHIVNFGASPVTTRRMGERSRIVGMRKNGEIFPAEASISRFVTADEWTYTVILRDVSERVRTEEELRRLAEQRQAAVDARDQIMAIVSHDLRNPVTAMRLCLSGLKDDPPPSPEMAADLLAAAQDSVGLMARLIQDLLDMTSIDAGRLALERRPQPLGGVLRRAAELQYGACKDNELTLRVDIDTTTDTIVDLDDDRMLQVLCNLIDNARKFSPAGGTISMLAVHVGDEAHIAVRDTGPGIPADELPHIFDRFWHERRGARQRSTGLGLAIAQGIVEAHGGRIEVDSALGAGSTFTVVLPMTAPLVARNDT